MVKQLDAGLRGKRTVIQQRLGHGRTRSVECCTIVRRTPPASGNVQIKPKVVIATDGTLCATYVAPEVPAKKKPVAPPVSRGQFGQLVQYMRSLSECESGEAAFA